MTHRLFKASWVELAAVMVLSLWSANCLAADITSVQARAAVGKWLSRDAAPLGAKLGGAALDAVTYRNLGGVPLFHVVPLEGGGFVVTSADDGIQPIITFSEGRNLAAESGNPLWALLNKDLTQRSDALAARRKALGGGRLAASANLPVHGSPEAEWADLLDARQITPQGLTSISDLRISPIVQSHWGQSTVSGFWGNYNCYNYYTPNGYVCGCVATAMAQIMRNHCYPTLSVSARTFYCSVDNVRKPLTMLGGVYNWSTMSLTPDEGGDTAPSATIRAEIGKICYDAGVSVGMQYASSGSGAYSYHVPDALVNVFGYASACLSSSYWGVSEEDIQNGILANLDHGYPVYLEISGEAGVHAVVADGYGYNNSVRYIHLNVGWNLNGNGGYQNAWYNVPMVDTAQGTFSVLKDIVYNIFPDKERKLVSGRVLSASGMPVVNATVWVRDYETGEIWRTLQTNGKGMYAFSLDGTDWEDYVKICATDGIYASNEIDVSASLSDNWSIGNVWGVDLYLSESVSNTVMLDANGGSGGSAIVTARVGVSLPYAVTAPSRLGYTFVGFFDISDSNGGIQYYDAFMNPVGIWHDVSTTVLYARWQAVAVRIGETLVPYSWLDKFNLGGEHEAAALADQDGDGSHTWQEYVAGTDPTNALSVFRITGSSPTNLVWSPNLPDRVYTIVGKTNLADAAEVWTSPTNSAHRFFRVKVELP